MRNPQKTNQGSGKQNEPKSQGSSEKDKDEDDDNYSDEEIANDPDDGDDGTNKLMRVGKKLADDDSDENDEDENDEGEKWNGFGILQFGFNDDHRFIAGLKTGKCIEVYDNDIVEISGIFVDDNLQVNSISILPELHVYIILAFDIS